MITIEESYRHVESVARKRAKNFYYSFLLLPRAKRRAMCAVYAFMRECDDRSDDPGASRDGLAEWRKALDAALAGAAPDHPVWPAFVDTARRFAIPHEYFHGMIEGVASDLEPRSIRTFEELYRYCYLVASVVGMTITHIYGFADRRALELAEKCGVAFQLTNILRDIGEDAANGRVYLPEEDLARFEVPREHLSARETSAQLRALLEFEAGRAREYYIVSRPLLDLVNKDSRAALWALMEIYRRLLERIEERDYEVLAGRARLSAREKTAVVLRAALGGVK
jgi:phytoene synthase